jgi:hypothetical protein
MDKDIVKRAMALSSKGLTVAQVSKRLGVNRRDLREAMSAYDDFSDIEAEVAVIVPANADLGSTAYNLLTYMLEKMKQKANSPFVSMGEFATASALLYKIYKEENENENAGDSNDPFVKLFGDEIKLLKE